MSCRKKLIPSKKVKNKFISNEITFVTRLIIYDPLVQSSISSISTLNILIVFLFNVPFSEIRQQQLSDEVYLQAFRNANSAATGYTKAELQPTNGISKAMGHFKNMKSQSEFKAVNMIKIFSQVRLESFNCIEGTSLSDALTEVHPIQTPQQLSGQHCH